MQVIEHDCGTSYSEKCMCLVHKKQTPYWSDPQGAKILHCLSDKYSLQWFAVDLLVFYAAHVNQKPAISFN